VASLKVKSGPLTGRTIELTGELVVGRENVDFVIDDPEVSRRHMVVRPLPGALEVEDLGSSNGTFVDDRLIEAPTRVGGGAEIRLGTTILEVEAVQPAESTQVRAVAVPQATKAAPMDALQTTAATSVAPAPLAEHLPSPAEHAAPPGTSAAEPELVVSAEPRIAQFSPTPPRRTRRSATSDLRAADRTHRVAVGLLIALAGLCLFVGSFAVWLDRQLLNTDNWVSTSSRILANRTVQNAVGAYIVRELFSSANVAGALNSALPSQLGDSVTGGVQQAASDAVSGLLAEPVAQAIWRDANRVAHREALDVLNGHSRAVSTNSGEVVLDLHPLVGDLAKQLGSDSASGTGPGELDSLLGSGAQAFGEQLLNVAIPADRGRLVILRSSQLQTAQDVVKAIRGLAIVLPIAVLVSLVIAMLLSRGWRWIALRRVGLCLLAAGIAVVVARRILESRVVDTLVSSSSSRAAGDAAWAIGTSLLLDIAVGLIVLGAVSTAASVVGPRLARRRRGAIGS
jgi:FHA domain